MGFQIMSKYWSWVSCIAVGVGILTALAVCKRVEIAQSYPVFSVVRTRAFDFRNDTGTRSKVEVILSSHVTAITESQPESTESPRQLPQSAEDGRTELYKSATFSCHKGDNSPQFDISSQECYKRKPSFKMAPSLNP